MRLLYSTLNTTALLLMLTSSNLIPITIGLKLSRNVLKVNSIPSHVFIFGLGYTGLALVSCIKSKFPDCIVSGTCRSVDKAENLKKLGIQPFIFDPDTNQEGLDETGKQALSEATHIVTMIPPISDFDKDPVLDLHKADILNNKHSSYGSIHCPDVSNDARYDGINDDIYEDDINGYEDRVAQNRIDEGIDNAPREDTTRHGLWIGYVSTTGVYGDHAGEWVTEQSPTLAPPSSKAYHRIAAENDWLALRAQSGAQGEGVRTVYPHVFRLGGIYGPGRSALDTVKRAASQDVDSQSNKIEIETRTSRDSAAVDRSDTPNWVSRIHVADICDAILKSMESPVLDPAGEGVVYNIADNFPAPRGEVMKFARELLSQEASMRKGLSEGFSVTRSGSASGTGGEAKISETDGKSSSLSLEIASENALNPVSTMSSERTRRRMTENKRVSNGHLVRSLGYVFKYPSYREGLIALAKGSNDPFE